MEDVRIPKSYRQAVSGDHASYWRDAIAKELAGLVALRTWDVVEASTMPSGANLMNCHYVFTVKRKADGSIHRAHVSINADTR